MVFSQESQAAIVAAEFSRGIVFDLVILKQAQLRVALTASCTYVGLLFGTVAWLARFLDRLLYLAVDR